MPGKGPAYPTSSKWRKQVRDAIDKMKEDPESGVTSDKTFADKAGIDKGTLSEALGKRQQTPYMPAINRALGWPEPVVLSTPDDVELWRAINALGERTIGRIVGMAIAKLPKP